MGDNSWINFAVLALVMSVFWLPIVVAGTVEVIRAWRCNDERTDVPSDKIEPMRLPPEDLYR